MNKDDVTIVVAFDVGSTTVVGAFVEEGTGKVLSAASRPNPQTKWGADILSRIRAISEDASLLVSLQAGVAGAMNEITCELKEKSGIKEFSFITAAGNSVMEHILLGISPKPLGTVPYKPAFKEARLTPPSELGLNAAPGGKLYTFPLIGGFVGGDTVAMLLKLGLKEDPATVLAIDIGTNSEIVLSHKGTLYAASAAAGPAFEGGEISSGMGAAPGAIEGVRIEGDDICLDVIGGVAPRGICGSGLVDAAGELLKAGVIDRSGRILDPDEIETGISARIRPGEDGNRVVLFRAPPPLGEISLTQADIRALQAAKGAIRSGVEILLERADIGAEEVGRVYLAGAFGSHLSKEGLETIGMLDVCWHDRTGAVGDAALDGAVMAASDEVERERAEEIAKDVKYVSLSGSKNFERLFIENLNF